MEVKALNKPAIPFSFYTRIRVPTDNLAPMEADLAPMEADLAPDANLVPLEANGAPLITVCPDEFGFCKFCAGEV